MTKQIVRYADYFAETMWRLRADGLLLVSSSRAGLPNVMTIGWCSIGIMWGLPVCTIMVRPSRYTYKLLEELPEFSVNVPPSELAEAVRHCGTVSGSNHDKFRETGLDPLPSWEIAPPVIRQCVVHYECRVVHRCDMSVEALAGVLHSKYYPEGNFHRYYFGEIVASYADDDALAHLAMPPDAPVPE
jgi:flavin reductase (DIM6/NTAB) family NADH-FMN oxidoreductase RutF